MIKNKWEIINVIFSWIIFSILTLIFLLVSYTPIPEIINIDWKSIFQVIISLVGMVVLMNAINSTIFTICTWNKSEEEKKEWLDYNMHQSYD